MLFQYGNKQTSDTTSYGPQIDNLIGRGYEGLGLSGLTDRIGGYKSSIAPLNASQNWGISLAQDAGHMGKRDFSGGILDAGRGVTGDDIRGLMNPYLETVGRSTLQAMGRERDNANAGIGARNANAVSFGGSGAALERAQLERGHGQNVGNAISGLMSGGWDRASNLATANADRALNANIAANSAYGDMMNRHSNAINGLMTTGAIAQAQDQANADLPWTDWERFMSGLPTPGATKTTNQPQTIDPLGLLIGGVGRMFGI